jgi:hypothetical protein
MGLPWMESLSAFADSATPVAPPKRFAVLFMGTGINEDHWSATGSGADMKLSKTLLAGAVETEDQCDRGAVVKALTGQGFTPGKRAACYRARTFRRAPLFTRASAWIR